MRKVYRLCIYDVLIVVGVLGTLLGLGQRLSGELLLWLFGLVVPLILALNIGRRLTWVFVVTSFVVAALVAFEVHRFTVLIVLDSIFLFVGSYVGLSLKLRIPQLCNRDEE